MGKRRQLALVDDLSERAVLNSIGGHAFVGSTADGQTLVCGACGERVGEHVGEHELMNVVILCPACGAANDAPDGPPQSGPEIHLLPGTFNLGDVVKGRPGTKLRGIPNPPSD